MAASTTPTYGDDYFYGTNGKDALHGGWGNDTLYGGGNDDKLYGEQNNDTLSGDAGNDTLDGGAGDDNLTGGAGKDTILGGSGDDIVVMTSHADATGDKVDGGSGVDTLAAYFSGETTAITFAANDPGVTNSFMGWFTLTGVEEYQILGGSGNDNLTGYLLDDYLDGGAGKDTLSGRDGDDYIVGGLGADILNGGSGDDYLASNSYDPDTDTKDVDKLSGGSGDDYLQIGIKDIADGGAGSQDVVELDFGKSTTGEHLTFSNAKITLANGGTIDHFESLVFDGGSGADHVAGGALADTISGGKGNDTLAGGDGDDALNGNLGNDSVHGNAGNDVITEDGATFTTSYDDNTGEQHVVVTALTGTDHYYGDAGDDSFVIGGYDGEAKTFDGGANTDSVDFSQPSTGDSDGDGSSTLSAYVDLSNQAHNDGLAKGDTFTSIEKWIGSAQDDTFIASSTGVTFDGGDGADVLKGGAGADTLIGGSGSDVMTGGAGKDVFDLSDDTSSTISTFGSNHWKGDEITDFKHGDDHIKLSLAEFGFAKSSDFHLVNGAAATTSDPTFLFDKTTHHLMFDEDGKGSDHSAVLIATLDHATSLVASDFLFG